MTGAVLTVVLMVMALVGPAVAYAGVDVVWPPSEKVVEVNQDPPIKFRKGDDYDLAASNNFAGNWSGSNANASYGVTVSGLSGGRLVVDRLVNVTVLSNVQDFNVEISDPLTGSFDPANVTELKIRLWNGTSAPTSDTDGNVRCWLDLTLGTGNSTAGNSQGRCENPSQSHLQMQVVFELASDQSTESSQVQIRPVDVRFA